MRKKITGFCLLAALFILINLTTAAPAFVPVDPNQPVRPLLFEDQALKETYQTILDDPSLAAEQRGQALARLADSYHALAAQTKAMVEKGIDHPVLVPLETYFSGLSETLSDMAQAFAATDPLRLTEANERMKKLDQEFESIKH